MGLLVGGTSLILVGITLAVTGSLVDLTEQAPALKSRAVFLIHSLGEWLATLPFIGPAQAGAKPLETQLAEVATENGLKLVSLVALGIPEALAAGLYLLFLFIEAGKFPARVRRVYPQNQAEELLEIFGHVNSAVASYLKAKVNSSLVLAIPVFLMLWLFGVKFAILWAVLTFVCNFIPYLGTVVAWSLPAGFAFLQWDGASTPIIIATLLMIWHGLNAAIIEPMIVGRAVGLSPLVILLALSLWGLLWGIPGMFMAVPLTVVGCIILENCALHAANGIARQRRYRSETGITWGKFITCLLNLRQVGNWPHREVPAQVVQTRPLFYGIPPLHRGDSPHLHGDGTSCRSHAGSSSRAYLASHFVVLLRLAEPACRKLTTARRLPEDPQPKTGAIPARPIEVALPKPIEMKPVPLCFPGTDCHSKNTRFAEHHAGCRAACCGRSRSVACASARNNCANREAD